MTETTEAQPSLSPYDVLLHLIVSLLAPMFLLATNGDIQFARLAALETVNSYRARNHLDLLSIAQIIACGLTALGSLSLSMEDDLSLSMTLRLRGSAVALNRVAEQNRRALQENRPPSTAAEPEPADTLDEAKVIADVEATQKRVVEIKAEKQAAPSPPTQAKPEATMSEHQRQAIWGAAAATVAGEYSASLIHLPPEQRKLATLRAAALSSCANDLLSGNAVSPPQPGDLARVVRAKTT